MYAQDADQALENLVKACDKFRDDDDVAKAVADAIYHLGYDPINPVKGYMVSLVIETEGTSISEALKEAIRMIDENPAELWAYIVEDEDGNKVDIGGWEAIHD